MIATTSEILEHSILGSRLKKQRDRNDHTNIYILYTAVYMILRCSFGSFIIYIYILWRFPHIANVFRLAKLSSLHENLEVTFGTKL